jgi:tetratricopeptide (TPR) repeat protein
MQRTEVLIRKNMTDTNAIRQLEEQLAETECQPDTDVCRKIDILNDLAWQLSDVDLKRAYALAESACTLAAHPDERDLPYQAGMAHGLRTLGYLNQRFGNHPLGLSQLIKAQEICEALSLSDVLTDVLDSITSIYGQIGDFATALSYCYRQLAAAQQIGDARRVVNAQNNLASIYLAMGDHARSIETFQQNLQKAVEIGFARIEAISLLNLAEMHLLAGNYEQALAYTLRGQQVCHTAGFALFAVYAQKAIGKIYLKLKKATGIPALEQALAMARAQASKRNSCWSWVRRIVTCTNSTWRLRLCSRALLWRRPLTPITSCRPPICSLPKSTNRWAMPRKRWRTSNSIRCSKRR